MSSSAEESIFEAASRIEDAAQRRAYLDQACAGDVALRERVEALLEAHLEQGESWTMPDRGNVEETVTEAGNSAADLTAALPREHQRFGDYQLDRKLGQGGMGMVFEAEHVPTGRRVALKVLTHRMDSPEARERFLREGRLAASINHPNSVYVYGTEEIDGIPVITMELLPGGTLKDRVLEKGPLPVAEAVECILQVIAGLEAAQAKGILHRDIKPSNCFIDSDGTVKVGDFGLSISTMARTGESLRQSGGIQGTPAFASPEQLNGEALDVRSDIYAVGATLYYLLTGRTPFKADDLVQMVLAVLETKACAPSRYRKEVPAGMSRLVLRALAKRPGKRFNHYQALRAALAPFAIAAAGDPRIRL